MKLLKIKYEIDSLMFNEHFSESYCINKKLYLFNQLIFNDLIYDFIDEKEGMVPFFDLNQIKDKIRVLNMKNDERLLPIFNDKYFIIKTDKRYTLIKETYFLGFSFSYIEIKSDFKYREIIKELNNILDKEYF